MRRNNVGFTETVLRDGQQSQVATRMPIDDMLPILKTMDEAGYAVKAAPDSISNRTLVIIVTALTLLMMFCGYLFFSYRRFPRLSMILWPSHETAAAEAGSSRKNSGGPASDDSESA